MSESEDTTQKSPEDRFQDAFQGIERSILRWSKVRGKFDPLLIEAAVEILQLRVKLGAARFDTTDEITFFDQLKARAAEMRERGQSHYNDPVVVEPLAPAMLDEDDHIVRRHVEAILDAQKPAVEFTLEELWDNTSLPAEEWNAFRDFFYDLFGDRDDIVLARDGYPPIYMKLANVPEPEKPRSGSSSLVPPAPEES